MKKTILRFTSAIISLALIVTTFNLGLLNIKAEDTATEGYAYTVTPKAENDEYYKVDSQYTLNHHTGDLDGLKGVDAWNFMPDKDLENNTTKYTGSFVFKSKDNSNITDICFDAYDNNWGSPTAGDDKGSRIKIYGSSDGEKWGERIYPTVEHTENYSDGNGNNSCNHRQTMKYTFNAEDNIKYVKFEITDTFFVHKVCAGLHLFAYNTLKSETGNLYANFTTPNNSYDVDSQYTLTHHTGDLDGLKGVDAWNFMPDKDLDNNNTKYTGSIIFKSEDDTPITDIYFDAYDNNWGSPIAGDDKGSRIKIYGSSDGEKWGERIYTTVEHTENYSDGNGNNSCNHRQTMKYTFNAEDNIKYVKFEITDTFFVHKVCAGLHLFAYNTLKSETGNLYANFTTPNNSYDVDSQYTLTHHTGNLDGLKGVDAWNFMPDKDLDNNNTKYTGAIIFKSENGAPITDIYFDAYDNNWGSPTANDGKGSRIKIYGSSNGATWGECIYPTVEHTEDYSDNNGNNSCNHRQTMKYTFNAGDNIKYVKFEIADTFFVHKVCAGLRLFAYNTDGNGETEEVKNYSETLALSQTYSAPEDLIWNTVADYTATDPRLGYNLMQQGATEYVGTAGDIVYLLPGSITDFQINVVNGLDSSSADWNGKMDFYVSADNEKWEQITTDAINVNGTDLGYDWIKDEFVHTQWGKFWQYSDTFPAERGYKYLKVSCGESNKDPAFRQLLSIKYNYEEIKYSHKLDLNMPLTVSENVNYGHVNDFVNDKGLLDCGFGYTVTTGTDFSDYASANGVVTYCFKDAITDFRIAVGNSLGSAESDWSGYMKFYVSADNKNWDKIDVTAETVKGTELGFSWKEDENIHPGWAKFWQYKGSLEAAKQYRYLKVEFVKGSQSIPTYRQFIGVDYNAVADNDINNDTLIDIRDLICIKKIIAGIVTNDLLADLNRDGYVDAKDVVILRKYLLNPTSSVMATDYLDDELDDWSKVYKHGADLAFDGFAPAMFGGDISRIKRWNDYKDCWIQWKLESGIKEFGLVIYGHKDYEELTVSVSKDGKEWTEIPLTEPNVATIDSEWVKRTYKWFDIDPANKYVMIDIGDVTEGRNVYFPNVSRIRINDVANMDDPDSLLEGRNAATFYVDSENGSDYNDGLSPETAYKSLSKISKRYFQPGDKLLFKSGLSFNGALKIRGKGSKENPITVGTYGGSKKAKISAHDDSAVFAQSANIIIENLEVTNPSGLKGIEVVTITTGENPNYTIRNCDIHDINLNQTRFEPSKYDTGAILVSSDGVEPTWINGLTIENNTINNVSKVGIIVGTNWAYRPGVWGKKGYYNEADDTGRWPNKNVVIRGNVITRAYGDSILSCMNDGAVIEKNTSIEGFYNPNEIEKVACAGIWTIGSNDTKIQYNEVCYHYKKEGNFDGEAFDIDIAEKRTQVQYNYSHDNYGGFLLMCNDYGKSDAGKISCDAVVRFNLSVNDGRSVKTVWQLDDLNNGAMIYNNTTYFGSWITHPFSHWQAASENFTFVNNIFVGQAGAKYDWSSMKNGGGWPNSVFKNNVCCNIGYQDGICQGVFLQKLQIVQ